MTADITRTARHKNIFFVIQPYPPIRKYSGSFPVKPTSAPEMQGHMVIENRHFTLS